MSKVNKEDFFKKTIVGGIIIVLPLALLAMGLRWLFHLVTDAIQPLTNLVVKVIGFPEIIGDLIVLTGMVGTCFVVGWVVTTAGGAWFHSHFDDRLSRYAPGYRLIKDIVNQFFGDASQSPFANGEVALVKLFGADNPTEVTAIITSRHPNGKVSIFMPTGPNPTSGNIYHVEPSQVTLRPDISIEDAFRSIIACGAGSGELFAEEPKSSEKPEPE
ncbi:MAG: DUF502 domain-containing protein [Pseudomonadales bacterium]|nr:DUF502 domain-containing protein [Pseudomonadales bacterium]